MYKELINLIKKMEVPTLYETEEIICADKTAKIKIVDLFGSWEWYVVEAEVRENDILFFGLVNGFEVEWGYFSLAEFMSVNRGGFPRIVPDYAFEETDMTTIQSFIKLRRLD